MQPGEDAVWCSRLAGRRFWVQPLFTAEGVEIHRRGRREKLLTLNG
jgi:hypothetical protein